MRAGGPPLGGRARDAVRCPRVRRALRIRDRFGRRQRAQVSPYAAHWEGLAAPEGEALLYAALGDSTAQGIGATDAARGYVGLVADRLREATGRPVRVVNLSRSGAKISHVLSDQIPRLADLAADVVTVSAGANDIIRFARTETIERRLRALASALRPGTVLSDMPCFGGGIWERRAKTLSAVVPGLCEEHGLVAARLHAATESRMDRRFYAEDWFHPSDVGYEAWADAFWEAIATLPVVAPQTPR